MKLRIIPKGVSQPTVIINHHVINGVDVSGLPEGAVFIRSPETDAAGIFDIRRSQGELHVTIAQHALAYECSPINGSHNWQGTDEWIDAADYDPNRCYIVATSAPEGAEYVKRENSWTVTLPQVEEEPTP